MDFGRRSSTFVRNASQLVFDVWILEMGETLGVRGTVRAGPCPPSVSLSVCTESCSVRRQFYTDVLFVLLLLLGLDLRCGTHRPSFRS